MLEPVRRAARRLKNELVALYFAYRHPRTPLYAKIWTFMVVAYAVSPIDLIPDFIPILGLLDDLILLPIGIVIALRLIPLEVMAESRARAANITDGRGWLGALPLGRAAAVVILGLWVGGALLLLLAASGVLADTATRR
ncbi:MAG: DUF1232 domain-containing protein [Chloroflexota bacterium]|nr:DUF1232 domain-containing protein [Chloroflexota bacterium]